MNGMVVFEMGVPPSRASRGSAEGAETETGAWEAVAVAKVNLRVDE